MAIKIFNEVPKGPIIKSGSLVMVGGDVILVTGDRYSPNFRGVRVTEGGADMEEPFRICDAYTFSGTVTISNK